MSAIKIYKCEQGVCYKHQSDNRYLGKFLRMDSRVRDNSAGAAGQSRAPIYVFEKEIIGDNYPADIVIPTACITSTGGRRNRRVTRKARRNRRGSYSRRSVK